MNHNLENGAAHEIKFEEQELIAFHLGEACDERGIRARLELDTAYAELSASIAMTLRIVSAEPVPVPDVNAAWQRFHNNLPQVAPARSTKRSNRFFLVPASALGAILLAAGLMFQHYNHRRSPVDQAGVLCSKRPTQPGDTREVAQHLDLAERWLTSVNHTPDFLEPITISEGDQLLANNAVYLRDARTHGDLPDAVVLERLGRVLTTARHCSERAPQFRIEMHTDALLFDLRVLSRNHTQSTGELQ